MVEGRNCDVQTNHKPLVVTFHQKPEKAYLRQLRHLHSIDQFTTQIIYVAGDHNIVSDSVPR